MTRMSKYIQLTQSLNDRPVWVQKSAIISVTPKDRGAAVYIVGDDRPWVVEESPESIVKQLEATMRKAEWIDKGYHEEWTFECSACGGWSPEEYDFCPHCGADMRKEAKDE